MSDSDEAEVASVLFRLPELIMKFESRRLFPPWGAKRKRSAPPMLDSPDFPPAVNGNLDFVSSSPTSPLAFSSVADLDSKRASSGLTEMMKMEISDGLMAEQSMKQAIKICGNSDSPLEGQSARRSQPLISFQDGVGPTGIPDLNAPAEPEPEEVYGGGWQWGPYDHHNRHYMEAAAAIRAEAAAARQRRHLIQRSKRATRGNRCVPPLF